MENKIKNDNFFQVKGFMINELKLKGTELMVFAIIHTIKECGGVFYGSREYLAQFSNSSVRNVQRALNELVSKNLLKKTTKINNGIKECSYISNYSNGVTKCHLGNDKMSLGNDKMSPKEKEKNLINNINNSNIKQPQKIELQDYLLHDISSVSKELWFTDMSIILIDNQCNVILNKKTYEKLYSKEWEFYKYSMERQLRFYNTQFNTNYELIIKEKVA